MRRFALMTVGVAGVVAAVGLLGCGSVDTPATTPASPTAAADSHDDGDGHHAEHGEHGDHASHGGGGDMAKMEAGLAKLSDADRASAKKQHVCPVTGDMLGTMGKPIKLTLKNHELWICCDGCKKAVEADPDKYLAKLNK